MRNYLFVSLVGVFIYSCVQKDEYLEYHNNGQIFLTGQFENGQKEGVWLEFDSLGKKTGEYHYDQDTLIKRIFYLEDRIFSEEEMRGDEIKHGLTITYYNDGTVESKTQYVDNYQFGEQLFYYPNGVLESKYEESHDGAKEFYQYYENGELFVYAQNAEDGIVTFHDTLGNKSLDLLYKDGIPIDTVNQY